MPRKFGSAMAATRELLFLTLAAVLFLKGCSAAQPSPALVVKGRVYCDTCRAGYFSKSSFYLPGAKVGVQCGSPQRSSRRSGQMGGGGGGVTAYAEGKTGPNGEFAIAVNGEHEGELCVALVLHSAHASCYLLSQRSAYATVALTRNAGLADNVINTGPFAFTPSRLAPFCASEVATSNTISRGE